MRIFKKPILKNLLFAALVTAALTAGTGVAHATVMGYTATFSFDGSSTPYSLSLGSFNPALGTLTDISLTLVTNLTPEVQLTNLTNAAQSFTNAQSSAPFTLTGPGNTTVTATASTGSIDGTAAAGPSAVSTFSGPTVQQTQTIDLASLISLYQDTGPLGFQAALGPFTSSASFASGTLGVGGEALVNGSVAIDYTYNAAPVPTPSALLLLATGFLGLAGITRRVKK